MNALNRNLELAALAKEYARTQIVHGCTQIENNELPVEYFAALTKVMLDQLRPLLNEFRSDPLKLLPKTIYDYEKVISISSKYSLGNCSELAMQAMDYLLTLENADSINAEIIGIYGGRGDHVFLVIGRELNSDLNDINSWGEHAVICDPWTNEVYPTVEALGRLQAYYRIFYPDGTSKNQLLNYDPDIHSLYDILDIKKIIEFRTQPLLIENYKKQLDLIEQQMQQYGEKLENHCNHLSKKYGNSDVKRNILNEKLLEIEHIISVISTLRNEAVLSEVNVEFRKLTQLLRKNLNKLFGSIQRVIDLKKEDNEIISAPRQESLKTKVRLFFKIPSKTEKIIDEANHTLAHNLR
jgi:hypothetical protein